MQKNKRKEKKVNVLKTIESHLFFSCCHHSKPRWAEITNSCTGQTCLSAVSSREYDIMLCASGFRVSPQASWHHCCIIMNWHACVLTSQFTKRMRTPLKRRWKREGIKGSLERTGLSLCSRKSQVRQLLLWLKGCQNKSEPLTVFTA